MLCNFGAVRRLDLLRSIVAGRGRWTEAVQYEVSQSSAYVPDLRSITDEGWLGEPLEVTGEEAAKVERIRVARFGGDELRPTRHLGEAQTCHVIRTRPELAGAVWLTDDEAAYDFGGKLSITTWDTREVLELAVSYGEIDPEGAFSLMLEMVAHERSPRRLPDHHSELGR